MTTYLRFADRNTRLRCGLSAGLTAGGLCLMVLLAGATPSALVAPATRAAGMRRSQRNGWDQVPAGARAGISNALGARLGDFHAQRSGGAIRLANGAQRLTADFGRRGVVVRSGAGSIALSLRRFGHQNALRTVPAAQPRADRNRVSYARGALREWYANGPGGLEQGFTVHARPRGGGPLTLELGLGGNLVPELRGGELRLDGAHTALRYGGLTVRDAGGTRLGAWLELRGRTLAIRADDRHARYPLVVDPFVQQARLIETDPVALGWSVAASDDAVAVGAALEGLGHRSQGAVYVFAKPAGGWSGVQNAPSKLTASDGAAGDQLGRSVAISGDTVVAAARRGAYVFVRPAGGWADGTQTATLTTDSGSAPDFASVAVAGDTIAAGAPMDTVGTDAGRGAAYAFAKPAGGWADATQTARLTASDGVADDSLGASVGISGDTVVAGAGGAAVGGRADQGAAYVFAKPAGGWADGVQSAKLTASDGAAGDALGGGAGFGQYGSVAIDGDTIVAGAGAADIGGHADQGAAYVFTKPAGAWVDATQVAKLTASDGAAGDLLGQQVAISGDTVVAGASGATIGGHVAQGAAYAFVRPGPGWANATQAAKLTSDIGATRDALGFSVAISRATIVAGAPAITADAAGAALAFTRPTAGWTSGTQQARLVQTDPVALGWSVAASDDAIAVGAALASVARRGQGAVYVFVKPAGGWSGVQNAPLKLTASDGSASDELGRSVAISGDTVVAAARRGAYVFVRPAGGWIDATQTAKLVSSDAPTLADFSSVSVSGATIVAGAPSASIGGDFGRGAAYVFVRPGGGWVDATQSARLTASDGAAGDSLGASVGVSGGTVVAGAGGAAVGGRAGQGAAYVFQMPVGGWVDGVQSAKLTASDGAAGDALGGGAGFGQYGAVAIDADTIVAGAGGADVGGHADQGAVYVFTRSGGPWVDAAQAAKLTASDGAAGDALGQAVAIAGDAVVGGAPSAAVAGHVAQGAAYAFVKPTSGWASATETARLTDANGVSRDVLGYAVANNAGTIVAGAPATTGDALGAAHVFVAPNSPPATPGAPALAGPFATPNRGVFDLGWPAAHDPDDDALTYTLQHEDADDAGYADVAAALASNAYAFVSPPEAQGTWTYRVKAADSHAASSAFSPASAPVKVDRGAPNAPALTVAAGQTAVTVGAVDWYADSVSIDVTPAGDPALPDSSSGSGVDPASFASPFVVSTNGTSTASRTVSDFAGNASSAGSILVHVDAQAPTVTIDGGCPAGPVAVGSLHLLDVSASDGQSGLAADPSGQVAIDTAAPGPHAKIVTATDRVGHDSSARCDYGVDAPPVIDSVTVTPTSPKTNDVLSVGVTKHDTDGDGVSLGYQWQRDAGSGFADLSGETTPTLDLSLAGHGSKGDRLRVVVTASDGLSQSDPATSTAVTVANSAPVLHASGASATAQYSDAITPFEIWAGDADGDALTFAATGLPAGLSLTSDPGATATVSGAPAVASGTYHPTLTVSDSDAAPDQAAATIDVGREDGSLAYTGDVSGSSLALAATFRDSAANGYDGPRPESGTAATKGDITKAWVEFDVDPLGSCGAGAVKRYAQVADTGPLGDGIGAASATYAPSTAGTYCVTARLVAGAGGAPNAYYDAPPAISASPACDAGLLAVACWRFGEPAGSTTAVDASPFANNGTYLNGVTLGVPGAVTSNTAARFDGVNDTVRVPESTSLDVGDAFSAEGWIKRSSTASSYELMNKGANGLQLVVMSAASGSQVWLRKAGVSTIARSSAGVPAGGYHHVLVTKHGAGSARIYLDGVDVTVPVSGAQIVQNTSFPLTFGSAAGASADYDEFALYARALSADEVAARFARGRP